MALFHDELIGTCFFQAGVDGLILITAGAGGHAGVASPFALVPKIRSFFPGTVVVAGAMGTGGSILAAKALGGDLAYMGTRFLATKESLAVQGYKDMIVKVCSVWHDEDERPITPSNLFHALLS